METFVNPFRCYFWKGFFCVSNLILVRGGNKVDVFEPMYVAVFLLLLGLLYLPVLLYTLFKFKLNIIGLIFVILSIGSYLLLGTYMVGVGYYSDEPSTNLIFGFGFLELTLLSYPYIFIALSVLLGKKGERF